ncbi:MAG TPA: asparagine synthase-related protein [Anaerolineae bacterium]
MSGICGLVNFDDSPVERELLMAMAQPVSYRGPDGISYWQHTCAGLAYLSQAITPESLVERQPLVSSDVVLVADGRIDNRDDLIRALGASGQLRTDSLTDVELILAAYNHWDTACAEHLLGDFAFALWDHRNRRFFAARDPMGLRPLYYWHDRQRLAFATEVQQLLTVPYIPSRLYEPAIGVFLTGPFLPLDWSFYEGIRQLAPAQALLADASGVRTWRYWDADPAYTIRYKHESDYAEHFGELFKDAVACRLRSIKPVGLSLSGGMDSGSIAATIGWLYERDQVAQIPFRAYCYAFEELSSSDERHISRGITSHYGLAQVDVPADHLWPLKEYPLHGPGRDDPYISPYQALHDALLATAQADGIGLMLSGYRGDEIVGGWHVDYLGMLLDRQWQTLMRELTAMRQEQNRGLWWAVRRHLVSPIQQSFWPRDGLRALFFGSPETHPYPPWVRPEFAERVRLADLVRDRFSAPRTIRRYGWHQRYRQIFSNAAVRVAVHAERKQAQFGMGYADPWSDRRLAEFALAAPQWIVHRYSERKRLARQAMRGVIPPDLRHRPAKIEPATLYERGFKERAVETIFGLIDHAVADDRGYIDRHTLRDAYEKYLQGIMPRYEFWWALSLEMWLRRFFS